MAYISKESNVRTKKCLFCKAKLTEEIDYKNVTALTRYLNRWNQIESAGRTGNCAKHQRQLTQAIKRARHLALMPFVAE
ncbi:MAG: 30S ribosomal protein S18 [Patescibacteria group bacterium]|jgi:small subunit ribosomal protein S18